MEKQIEETELDLQSILFLLRIALKDKDENTCFAALETLAAIGKPEAVPVLAIALENSSLQVRLRAISALFHFPEKLRLPLLLRKLTDEEPAVRAFAANSMWNIEDENAAETLFNLMLTEESFPVRLAFSAAIGKMGFSSSASQLMKILDDENADISLKHLASLALQGIWKTMMKPRNCLSGNSLPLISLDRLYRVWQEITDSPDIIPLMLPPPLVFGKWRYTDPFPDTFSFPFHLQESYDKYFPFTLFQENSMCEFTKTAYMQRIVQCGGDSDYCCYFSHVMELQNRDLADVITKLLNDNDPSISSLTHSYFTHLIMETWGFYDKDIMAELAESGNIQAKALLKIILKMEESREVLLKKEAIYTDESVLNDDFKYSAKPEANDSGTSEKAVSLRKVLSNLHDYSKDDVVCLLISLFNDENYGARDEVVRILGEIDTELAREYIKKASVDKDPAVRRAAEPEIVKTFTNIESLEIYLTHPVRHLRRQAVKALGQLHDKECIPLLMEALEDEDPEVEISAVNALASLGEVKAVEKMVEILNRLENIKKTPATVPILSFPKPEAIGFLLKSAKKCNRLALVYVISALKALGSKIGEEPV